jgi:TolB-like protein/Flp pilus assembly protein TadD
MSAEKGEEYFSDGLAEEVLNALATVPGLRVAARTSSFQFRGQTGDIRSIAKRLNVATVLEGSVRRQNKRTRIAVQLIQAVDGFNLWAKSFDREMDDIFAVQDEVASSVTSALTRRLLPANGLAKRTNPEAYDAYLQARSFAHAPNKARLEQAVSLYDKATQLDPSYGPAWAELGTTLYNRAYAGWIPPEEGFREARSALEHALNLDPDLGRAHEGLGLIKEFHDWDWDGANRAFQKALKLRPGAASALADAGSLAAILGNLDESISLRRRAINSDPLSASPTLYLSLGDVLARDGQYEGAEAAVRKAIDVAPAVNGAHFDLAVLDLARSRPREALSEAEREPNPLFRLLGTALAYHALGQRGESDAKLSDLIADYGRDAQYQIAEAYAFRGEAGKAFESLDRAYAERDPGLPYLKTDLLLKSLHGDRRFTALLTRMRLTR